MDPKEFREVGHQVVDLLAEYLDHIEEKRVFPDVEPRTLSELFDEPLPLEASSSERVLDELESKLFPYCTNVGHPGYMGLITPSPNPVGVIADFICSAINQNVGAYSIGPSAVAMERRVVRWLTDLCGYDAKAGGNLTSGGMTANFIGLKVGRDAVTGDVAQHEGISQRWAVYASEERHVSVDKAVDCVGLGRNALRALPTDDKFRVRIDALEEAIARDKQAGIRPMCIVGMFGTTNTGAVDDIRELRRIADREGMWLHADGAYGGGMLLSHEWSMRDRGLELADSITIDPHKWFYAPLDAGAVLVKDHDRLTASFGIKPSYLTDELDQSNERYQYYVHGFEQSRRFRSLKVWMSFKRYGARRSRGVDRQQCASGKASLCAGGKSGSSSRPALRRCRRSAFASQARGSRKRNRRSCMPRSRSESSRADASGFRPPSSRVRRGFESIRSTFARGRNTWSNCSDCFGGVSRGVACQRVSNSGC